MTQVSEFLSRNSAVAPLLSRAAGKRPGRQKAQQGAALIISLVILVSMTMLGITTMKSATTEFTMVGNLRESAITFQAAELALKTGERVLAGGMDPANMLTVADVEPNYLSSAGWSGAEVTTVSTTDFSLANIPDANYPSYILKSLGRWDPDIKTAGTRGFGGTDSLSTAQQIDYFRITARGLGQTGNTSRTVQSFYGRLVPKI
jgi:type IV pilus assembly protein PilX